MSIVGYVKKLNAELFGQIVCTDDRCTLNGKEVLDCEFCGVVLSAGPGCVVLCDFHGKTELIKKQSVEIDGKGPFVFSVRVYGRGGRVRGFCRAVRKTTIYEEIVFNVEVQALLEQCCY